MPMLSTTQMDEDAAFSFSKCQSRCLLLSLPLSQFVSFQGVGEEADRLCNRLANTSSERPEGMLSRLLLAAVGVCCCGTLASPLSNSGLHKNALLPRRVEPGFGNAPADPLARSDCGAGRGIPARTDGAGGRPAWVRRGTGAMAMALRGGEGGGEMPVKRGFMGRMLIKDLLERGEELVGGSDVRVCGWARTVRVQGAGSFAFLELNDGSCFQSIQIIADKGIDGWDSITSHPHAHTSWSVQGTLVPSPGGGQAVELRAISCSMLGAAPPADYPLAKGRMPLDHLRGMPHLRPRTNTIGAVGRLRDALAGGIDAFFRSNGFVKLHSPIITASDCEGAGQLFSVSTLLSSGSLPPGTLNASTMALDFSRDFFKRPSYLTVSGQLQAEAYACALGSVYTFGPTFRAEDSHTTRHLAEFWMVEPEMAFANLEDDMDCAEGMLKHVIKHVLETLPQDMAFFDGACAKGVAGFSSSKTGGDGGKTKGGEGEGVGGGGGLIERLKAVVETPFVRMSYSEAVEKLQASGHKFEIAPVWGVDLSTEQERFLTEKIIQGPVIVYNYPKGIKAFYMRLNDDDKTVAAMDVLFPKCGEIVGGSQREDRLEVLEERMAESGLSATSSAMSWYADLRRFGGVPHAGFGLGFERLVMFASGLENIRDVIPFPRFPGHALC